MGSRADSPDDDTVVTAGTRVRDVVRDVVAEVAQSELPVVDGLFRLDDATAVRRLSREPAGGAPLSFGLGDVVVLVTPVVWLVVDHAAKRFARSAVDSATKRLKALLRKVFRRRTAPAVVPPLTREQLTEVRQHVLDAAAQRGLGSGRAMAIADAVVARLVLTPPGDDAERSTDQDDSADGDSPVQG